MTLFPRSADRTIPRGVTLNLPAVQCCPSCQIIARAVARLAYNLGYDETGDEITELMGEEEA